MHFFSVENLLVGERPVPRSETTRPDERKITIIKTGLHTLWRVVVRL